MAGFRRPPLCVSRIAEWTSGRLDLRDEPLAADLSTWIGISRPRLLRARTMASVSLIAPPIRGRARSTREHLLAELGGTGRPRSATGPPTARSWLKSFGIAVLRRAEDLDHRPVGPAQIGRVERHIGWCRGVGISVARARFCCNRRAEQEQEREAGCQSGFLAEAAEFRLIIDISILVAGCRVRTPVGKNSETGAPTRTRRLHNPSPSARASIWPRSSSEYSKNRREPARWRAWSTRTGFAARNGSGSAPRAPARPCRLCGQPHQVEHGRRDIDYTRAGELGARDHVRAIERDDAVDV